MNALKQTSKGESPVQPPGITGWNSNSINCPRIFQTSLMPKVGLTTLSFWLWNNTFLSQTLLKLLHTHLSTDLPGLLYTVFQGKDHKVLLIFIFLILNLVHKKCFTNILLEENELPQHMFPNKVRSFPRPPDISQILPAELLPFPKQVMLFYSFDPLCMVSPLPKGLLCGVLVQICHLL